MKSVRRECCNYCMWLGPVNQDGTMRKHRPAREGTVSGERKIQDFTKPHCTGSNKPYARFGCDTEETSPMTNQQTTARTAAGLPKGTRVTNAEGRMGTVNGANVGRIAIQGHANYGREYIGVDWDAVEGDMGLNRRSRPFVDELRIIETASETSPDEVTEVAPRFVVNQLGSGYFAVRVIGHDRVQAVEVCDLSTGVRRVVPCDVVVFTGDWIPDHELARLRGLRWTPTI